MERKRGRLLILIFLLLPLSLFSEFLKVYGIPRCRIRAVKQDGLGFLWVLTDKGLFAGEGRIFRPVPRLQQKIKGKITGLFPSKRGLWLVTDRTELALWNWSNLRVYRWKRGKILGLKEEEDGLLVCSEEGVFRWVGEQEEAILSGPVKECWAGKFLWVRLADRFLKCFSSKCFELKLPEKISSHFSLCSLPEGLALVENHTLWIKRNSGWKSIELPFSRPLFISYMRKKIWIGSEEGLWTFTPEGRLLQNLPFKKPSHLEQDWEDNLWLATERDLYIDPAIPDVYRLPSSALLFFKNKEGKLLLLLQDGRLYDLREKPFFLKRLPLKGGIKSACWCSGKLMLEARGNLFLLQHGRLKELERFPGGLLPSGCHKGQFLLRDARNLYLLREGGLRKILELPASILKAEGRRGSIFTLTTSGLFVWKEKLERAVEGSNIRDFAVDSSGRLWLATSDGILLCKREGSGCRRVPLSEVSPDVLSVDFDGDLLLWAVTSSEVIAIDESGRERALFPLPSRIAKPVLTFASADSQLWVAAGRKLFRFSFRKLRGKPPLAVVKSLRVDGKVPPVFEPLSCIGRKKLYLKLSPPPHRLILNFSTFSFLSPGGVVGFLQLEGPNGRTIHAAKGGELVFSPTLPGKYKIILRACRRGRLCCDPVAIFIEIKGSRLSLAGLVKKILMLLLLMGLLLWGIYNSYRSALFRRQVSLNTYRLMQAKAKIQQQNIMLAELSRTDPLTGLHNRRVLEEQLSLEIALTRREAEQLIHRKTERFTGSAVIMLDLDNFKEVNDRFGHEAGDRVLKAIALALKKALRETDLLVRWGGEEFIVLARKVSRKGLVELVKRLLLTIKSTEVGLQTGYSLSLTASAGFVCYPLCLKGLIHPGDWMILVDVADRFLYMAKQQGKARACGVVWKNPWIFLASERTILQRLLRSDLKKLKCVEFLTVLPQSDSS